MEIVAEFTYNHFGDINRALRMIDMAKISGATSVKIEVRNSARYFRNNYAIKKKKEKFEFSDEQIQKFSNHCEKSNISWFASVHDLHSLKRILLFHPKYIKVASREARCLEFLEAIKKIIQKKFPLLISTGGLSFSQIKKIYSLLKNENLTLIHTSCLYPCPKKRLNINRIKQMKVKFQCPVGYSGHEEGYLPSLYAVAIGADYIERHFTLEEGRKRVAKAMKEFNDDLCTLSPSAFKQMAEAVKIIYELRNQKANQFVNAEELLRVNIYGKPAWEGTDIYLKPVN